MEIEEIKIHSINDLLDFALTHPMWWFRGHSKCWNTLQPTAFRSKKNNSIEEFTQMAGLLEGSTIDFFRGKVEMLLDKVPNNKDYIGWLMLMQHYGFDTRLLDWTTNIFIAAFFTVTNNEEDDGEIWAIDPKVLNEKNELNSVQSQISNRINFLAAKAFPENTSLREVPEQAISFIPKYVFSRMSSQFSVFTIHHIHSPGMKEAPCLIKNTLVYDKSIKRLIVSPAIKPKIEAALHLVGVRYETVFPDMEGFSKGYKRRYNSIS